MTEATSSQLSDKGQGRCSLAGALTLESAPWLWKELQAGLLFSAREADLSGINAADSAGLALLLAWKAHCRKHGGELTFSGVPPTVTALAALTGAQALL
jgi:phospholipid transport system transporter-binding protein